MLWNFVITISGEEATKKVRFRRRVEVRLLPEGRDVENQMRGEVQVRRKGMQLFATISHIIDGRCVRPRQTTTKKREKKKAFEKSHQREDWRIIALFFHSFFCFSVSKPNLGC